MLPPISRRKGANLYFGPNNAIQVIEHQNTGSVPRCNIHPFIEESFEGCHAFINELSEVDVEVICAGDVIVLGSVCERIH